MKARQRQEQGEKEAEDWAGQTESRDGVIATFLGINSGHP